MLQLGDRKVCKRARRSCRHRDSPGDHIVEWVARERDLAPDTVCRRREQHRRLHDELRVARWDGADRTHLAECRRALVEHVPIGDELLELVRSENDIAFASRCVVRGHISGALDDRERQTGWQPVRQREPRIGRHRRHDDVGPRVDLRGDVRADDIERAAAGADSRHPILPYPREHGGLPSVPTEERRAVVVHGAPASTSYGRYGPAAATHRPNPRPSSRSTRRHGRVRAPRQPTNQSASSTRRSVVGPSGPCGRPVSEGAGPGGSPESERGGIREFGS